MQKSIKCDFMMGPLTDQVGTKPLNIIIKYIIIALGLRITPMNKCLVMTFL